MVSERLAYGAAMVGEAPDMAAWFEDGRRIVAELRAAMHGEIDPRSLDEDRVRHWQEYGRNIESGAVAVGQPGIKEWLGANPDAAQATAGTA
jgi:hypothetical protein